MNTKNPNGTSPRRPIHRQRWFIAFLTLALLLGALLALLPLGIGYGMKSWLLQSGADRAEIENVDFNPITGSFADWAPALTRLMECYSHPLLCREDDARAMHDRAVAVDAVCEIAQDEPAQIDDVGIELEHEVVSLTGCSVCVPRLREGSRRDGCRVSERRSGEQRDESRGERR